MAKRKALDTSRVEVSVVKPVGEEIIMKIAIKDLRPSSIWHGKRDSVDALADNIKVLGGQPIQKPIVRRKGKIYEVVCGWRRVLASEKAGTKEIDCEVREMNDSQAGMTLLSENLFRSNLDDVTKAEICKKIYESSVAGGQQSKNAIANWISERMGVANSTVRDWLQTMDLPDGVQKIVKERKISGTVARRAHAIGSEEMVKTAVKKDIGRDKIQKISRQLSEIKELYPEEHEKIKKEVVSGKITEPERIKERAKDLHVKKTWDSLTKQFGSPDIQELAEKDILPNIERIGAFFQMLKDNADIKQELFTRMGIVFKLRSAMKLLCVSRTAEEEDIKDYVFFCHDGENTHWIINSGNYRPGSLMKLCIEDMAEEDPELAEEIRDDLKAKPGPKVVH